MRTQWLTLAFALVSVIADAQPRDVAARMRHVNFQLGHGIELRVDDLVGHLVSRTQGPPVFDDVNSYNVAIDFARVSMTADSLTNLLNNHVFAAADSPIKKLKVTIENGELVQTGVLNKGVDVPFTMRASVAPTPDGKIRIHPTKMKAAGIIPKRMLDFFGLHLEKLVKLEGDNGVTIDKDDLLLDPARLLPPPRIAGRLTKVAIENGVLVQEFGAPVAKPLTPPVKSANYMYYRGGVLRFGKLTMQDADLLLVDENPKDPFEFSPERYNEQLVAGYSKNTPSHGLITHMPDLRAVRAQRPAGAGAQRQAPAPAERDR
jgi:hypothetical protein